MIHQSQCVIEAEHPSLAGHFPGNPVVPGVLILLRVEIAMRQALPDRAITALPNVKFLSPLLPGEVLDIQLDCAKPDNVKFHCRVAERLIAQGSLDTR